MKKGLYEKEYNDLSGNNRGSRITIEERQKRKAKRLRKQKRRKQLFLGIGILPCLFIIVLLIVGRKNPLEGRWYMDEVTVYEFYDGSKGTMVLPSAAYEFTYSITDNNLSIDFKYEGAKDAQYIFTIEGNTLTLEGGNTTTQGTYVLKKSESN